MAREAGAKNVYFASASPPVRYPNLYGIDMPSAQELIAHNRTVDEICAQIGADGLIFLDLEDLISITKESNSSIQRFECAIFNGEYLTGDETQYLKQAAISRDDNNKKLKKTTKQNQIDLHNYAS